MQIAVQAVTTSTTHPLINNIAQRVASGTGGDISLIARVLQQIATQVSDSAGEASATKTINLIASEVNLNSESAVSLSVILLQSDDRSTVNKLIQDIAQQISQGATVPEIIAHVVLPAMVGIQNANQLITQTAQSVISGNADMSGQLLRSSLIVCPARQQDFNLISEECFLDQKSSIFYTDDKCKRLGIADMTTTTTGDGSNTPTYAMIDTMHNPRLSDGISSVIQANFNTQNIICVSGNNWQYEQNELPGSNYVIAVSTHGNALGQVEKVIQQIVLKIAIQGGPSASQRALSQIANQVADNPKGPVSQSIFKLSHR